MNILTYLKEKMAKSQNRTSENTTRSKEDGLKELKDFIDDQKPASSSPEPPSYQRFEYDEPTDEELYNSAKEELGDQSSGESAIRSEYEQKRKELDADKENSLSGYNDSSARLKEAYETASENMSNDALKRGLARSSIAALGQTQVSKAYVDDSDRLLREYNAKISDIDKQIADLGKELVSAIDDYKADYASKLAARLSELRSEREKNKKEAIKYNNSLLKDEYEESLARQKSEDKTVSAEDNEAFQKALYDKMTEVLSSLSPADAKEVFSDPMFRNNLGDKYYYALYSRFGI